MIDKVISQLESFKYDGNNLEILGKYLAIKDINNRDSFSNVTILKSMLMKKYSTDARLSKAILLIEQRYNELLTLIDSKLPVDFFDKYYVKGKPLEMLTFNPEIVKSEKNYYIIANKDKVTIPLQNYSKIFYYENKYSLDMLITACNQFITKNKKIEAVKTNLKILDYLTKNKLLKEGDTVIFPKAVVRNKNNISIAEPAISKFINNKQIKFLLFIDNISVNEVVNTNKNNRVFVCHV